MRHSGLGAVMHMFPFPLAILLLVNYQSFKFSKIIDLPCYFQVILFDIGSVYHKLNKWKTEFWEAVHIGIPDADTESNDALVLGFLVTQFIAEVRKKYS